MGEKVAQRVDSNGGRMKIYVQGKRNKGIITFVHKKIQVGAISPNKLNKLEIKVKGMNIKTVTF